MSDFARVFGRPPECTTTAPGRVNLIGEHTDDNGGYVLPLVLPLLTRVELARRADRTVQAASTTVAEGRTPVSYDIGREQRTGHWIDCVQGVTLALAAEGHYPSGFDLLVSSHVPIGCGLSSSAALEVALLRALRMAEGWPLDDLAIARFAHRGEADLMDGAAGMTASLACSLGQASHALFVQAATLETLRVPMPASVEVGLVHAGLDDGRESGYCSGAARNARRPQPRWGYRPSASCRSVTSIGSRYCRHRSIGAPSTSSPRTRACFRPSAP